MTMSIAALIALPSLAFGSFLNVVASRLPGKRSIVHPPSACESCETPIRRRDNIPLLSFVLLRGACRSCGARIGWRHPAVEAATGVFAVTCVIVFGATWKAAAAVVFTSALVAITATDIERRVIPNAVVIPAALFVLVLRMLDHPSAEWPVAGLVAALFLFVAALIKPGGMGMGDVKLALLMGTMLGRTVPVALFVGMLAALAPSAILFARHGMKARKMTIPFGPFLALGSVVALFVGGPLLGAYLGTLG
jgi:leader peptidase (prepilin peptidase) / N-methyltransferase